MPLLILKNLKQSRLSAFWTNDLNSTKVKRTLFFPWDRTEQVKKFQNRFLLLGNKQLRCNQCKTWQGKQFGQFCKEIVRNVYLSFNSWIVLWCLHPCIWLCLQICFQCQSVVLSLCHFVCAVGLWKMRNIQAFVVVIIIAVDFSLFWLCLIIFFSSGAKSKEGMVRSAAWEESRLQSCQILPARQSTCMTTAQENAPVFVSMHIVNLIIVWMYYMHSHEFTCVLVGGWG